MGSLKYSWFIVALFVSLGTSNREDKALFDNNFWEGFEKGIRNTADMIHRVSENLEVAVDQLSDTVGEEFTDMADRIEDRVEQSLPPFLRGPQLDSSDIQAVSGPIDQDGIDDGLKVYFGDNPSASENVPTKVPGKDQVAYVDRNPKPTTDHHFGFGFEGSLFRPFSTFDPFGIRRRQGSPSTEGGLFNIFRRRQWWNGPNVCVDREEIDEPEDDDGESRSDTDDAEPAQNQAAPKPAPNIMFGIGSMEFSSCQETSDKYSCVTSTNKRGISKTVKVVYRCCHGFVKDSSGCTKVDLGEMPTTLTKVDAGDFLSLFKASNLLDALDASNLTVFAPSDEAVQEFMDDLEENNEINLLVDDEFVFRKKRDARDLSPFLMGHLVDGLVYAGDLSDEQVIVSKNGDGSTLRINTYASFPPTVTVNCARILTANQHSLRGVVHTIDQVLTPVTRSIADVIGTDPQFSILRDLVTKAGLMDQLDQATQLTVFAPTNSAFKKLPASMLDGLMEGTFCLKAVLMNHILPNTICSAAVTSKAKTLNMLDEFLMMDRSDDDELSVGEAEITTRDIITTSGVIHVTDGVLIPQEAKPVVEVLESHNLTRFLELIDHADMRDELNGYIDVTVFAPSNKAFDALSDTEMGELMNDKEKLREVLRHHVTSSALQARDINNNHITTTQADFPLRINLYSRVPLLADIIGRENTKAVKVTAGCSRASRLDSRACGAVVHIVNDLLRVPESSILRQLEKEPSHSIFLQMIRDTGLHKDLDASGPYTVLAPSNHALRTLPEEELKDILESEELMKKIVKHHILYENICCSGINPNNWIFMDRKRAMDNSRVHVRRAPNGRLMADRARITKCGAPAENGIVHTVNRLLVDPVPKVQDMALKRRRGSWLFSL